MWLVEWHRRNTSTTKHALAYMQYWSHTHDKHLKQTLALFTTDTSLDARYTHLTQVILICSYTHATRMARTWHHSRERTTVASWTLLVTVLVEVRLVLLRATMISSTLERTYIVSFSFVLQRESCRHWRLSLVGFNVVLKFQRELRLSLFYWNFLVIRQFRRENPL